MTGKPPFLDYEPLKPGSSESVAEKADEFSFKKAEPASTADWDDDDIKLIDKQRLSTRDVEVADQPKRVVSKEDWIHKHGHSLSYAGIYLFSAFVFFRPYEFSPSLMWLSSFAFWIALVTTFVFVFTQLALENTITARPREVNLVLLLTLTGILSIPLALEPDKAFASFKEFFKVVLIFIIMVNVVRTEKRLKRLWILVLIATCILCVNAINDFRLGNLALQGQRIKGAIGGLFDNPNDLALHLVMMFPIALGLSLSSRSVLKKLIYFAIALLIVGGIVATFSRGGFLALVVTIGVLLWKLVRSARWLIVPLAVSIVLLFVLFAPGGYRARLSTSSDESAMARFDDFKRSIFIAVRHPIFGVGMDNYILFSNANKSTHNAYTQVAAEMGAGAAVIYILFMLAPFKRLRAVERESYGIAPARRYYYAAVALQASLAGYMVASFFASVAYLWYIYYLVAYAVCLRRIYDSAVQQNIAPVSNNPLPSRI